MMERATRTETGTVRDLAGILKMTPDRMLSFLRDAALPHANEADTVTKEQKAILLRHLKSRTTGAQSGASTPVKRPAPAVAPRRPTGMINTSARSPKVRSPSVKVKTKKGKVLVNRPAAPGAEPVSAAPPPREEDTPPAIRDGEGTAVDKAPKAATRGEITRIREEEESRKRAVDEKAEAREARREAEAEEQRQKEEAARKEAEVRATEEQRLANEAEKTRGEQAVDAPDQAQASESGKDADATRPESTAEQTTARKSRSTRTEKVKVADKQTANKSIAEEQARAVAAERNQGPKRRGGKTAGTVKPGIDDDEFGDGKARHRKISLISPAKNRRTRRPPRRVNHQGGEFRQPTKAVVREVEVPETITVGELAQRMSSKVSDVVKTLLDLDVSASINQMLDQETAGLVAETSGHKVKFVTHDAVERELDDLLAVEGTQEPRPPVVTVMGHVDHGKTSLLDRIRNTRVASGEAGGITQHIGAYNVEAGDSSITFIDTPGHAAFSAMRARGAGVTDIVVLVVAADDGVMPQTEEAVQHAQAAEVPIIVAINKIDLEGANPDQIRNELASRGLAPEEWGGDTQYVSVSAATGEGIEELLEAILLRAEMLELTAVTDMPAQGAVVESRLARGRGPVATLLVRNGQLQRGDVVIAGQCTGRVRQLIDDASQVVNQVSPAMPVEVLGLSGTPEAGADFWVVENERKAREIAEFRSKRTAEQQAVRQQAARMDVLASLQAGERVLLGVVVKADVRGSLEAVLGALNQLGNDEVGMKVIGSGVGPVNESDITLAMASDAMVLGFNVKLEASAKSVREREGVETRFFSVIYELVDEVRDMLSRLLAPEVRESVLGTAEVREVYESPKFGHVAGCLVVDGQVVRNKLVRLLRQDRILATSQLHSLRRFKDDVAQVASGTECGIGVMDFKDIKVGDVLQVYEEVSVAREL